MRERKQVFTVCLSEGCNNNCVFCMESREREARKPSAEEIKKISQKFDIIDFSSGEPTTSPELPKYAKMASKYGFKRIGITTNGRMLSIPSYARRLVKAGVNEFKLSIHGSNSFIHDSLTRTPGSFEQSIQGLENISKLKDRHGSIRLDVLTTVTKQNYKDLPEAVKLFSGFSVDQLVFNLFEPIGEAYKFRETLMPKYSDVERYINEAVERNGDVLKRKNIRISAHIPVCILRDSLKRFSGNYEVISKGSIDNPDTGPTRRGRNFIAVCKSCPAKSFCDGVRKAYIEMYGESEFSKVKDMKWVEEHFR